MTKFRSLIYVRYLDLEWLYYCSSKLVCFSYHRCLLRDMSKLYIYISVNCPGLEHLLWVESICRCIFVDVLCCVLLWYHGLQLFFLSIIPYEFRPLSTMTLPEHGRLGEKMMEFSLMYIIRVTTHCFVEDCNKHVKTINVDLQNKPMHETISIWRRTHQYIVTYICGCIFGMLKN